MKNHFIFCTILILFFIKNHAQNRQYELESKRNYLLSEIKKINDAIYRVQKKEIDLSSKIEFINKKIESMKSLVYIIDSEIQIYNISIAANQSKIDALNKELNILKKEYASMIERSYIKNSSENILMFILASDDFFQAIKRLQYLKQYTDYRKKQGFIIFEKKQQLEETNNILNLERKEQEVLKDKNTQIQKNLALEKGKQQRIIRKIKSQKSLYLSQIKKKKEETEKLDRTIEKLIKTTIIKSNKLNGGNNATEFILTNRHMIVSNKFMRNKGKLISPVKNGLKTKPFGKYSDPLYKNIKYNNNGVTISAPKGEGVRAVFEGEVSSILLIPGGKKAIQIRHGNYISTYYNLDDVFVRKGEWVKEKDEIGTIMTASNGKTEMKFFLYKDTNKLNPEEWIYRL